MKKNIQGWGKDPVGSVNFLPAGSGTFFLPDPTCNNGYIQTISSWTNYLNQNQQIQEKCPPKINGF